MGIEGSWGGALRGSLDMNTGTHPWRDSPASSTWTQRLASRQYCSLRSLHPTKVWRPSLDIFIYLLRISSLYLHIKGLPFLSICTLETTQDEMATWNSPISAAVSWLGSRIHGKCSLTMCQCTPHLCHYSLWIQCFLQGQKGENFLSCFWWFCFISYLVLKGEYPLSKILKTRYISNCVRVLHS